jgi:DNA repair protein RAD5
MVEFRGCTIIDCPAVLHSGADLIVSLSVYMLPAAFQPHQVSNSDVGPKPMFDEGKETLDEQSLRERKSALLQLFNAVGIRARSQAKLSKPRDHEMKDESIQQMRNAVKTYRTEIVGDGEEIEVEDGEELSDNELDMIYKRSVVLDCLCA